MMCDSMFLRKKIIVINKVYLIIIILIRWMLLDAGFEWMFRHKQKTFKKKMFTNPVKLLLIFSWMISIVMKSCCQVMSRQLVLVCLPDKLAINLSVCFWFSLSSSFRRLVFRLLIVEYKDLRIFLTLSIS